MNKLTFVSKAHTEQSGGGVMLDFLTLHDGTILCISQDMIGLYRSMESFENNIIPPKTIDRYETKASYLLFGKEVCEVLAEDGIDEAGNLIEDGAEYLLIIADNTPAETILDLVSNYGGYSFITEEEYNFINQISV
jgi:hypothetical protein